MRIILSLLLLFVSQAKANELTSFALKNNHLNTKVTLQFKTTPKYKAYNLTNPSRIVLDLDFVQLKTNLSQKNLPENIKKIRMGQHPKSLRLVFDLKKFPQFSVKRQKNNLILNMVWHKNAKKKPFTVAIDPGHGGKDPGSIARSGIKEKDITLGVSLKLQKLLEKNNIKSVLTRANDKKIDLFERMQIARNNSADLFISLHADSFYNNKVSGVSIYTLSEKEDNTVLSKWLSNREKRTDLSGGLNIKNKDPHVASTILEMSQKETRNLSNKLAKNLILSLKKQSKLHTERIHKANLMVLKSPDIPSTLIELGFLSNEKNAKLLKTEQYQFKLAKGIKNGIVDYLKNRIHNIPQKLHRKVLNS